MFNPRLLALQIYWVHSIEKQLLSFTNHVPPIVDPNVWGDDSEPDEIPAFPQQQDCPFAGIIGNLD